ncbi:MAG: GNAT family N-acetyltransferase [Defluviitaleaceae bacterium]|nr:GNAT family N-acetyltransferase [Defluviitaleaceae bacterium]
MKTLETERLILREFREDDFAAVQSYAGSAENLIYMAWGPNTEEQTLAFFRAAVVETADDKPEKDYIYAAVLKESDRNNPGKLIGGCDMDVKGGEASLGWILHRDYWKRGYGPELGEALLRFGFDELNLRRVVARCDAENYGSYRVMEKIGMRREGRFIDARPANKLSDRQYGDELSYAILKDEWDTRKEIARYNNIPVAFGGFIEVPELSDGEIRLVCTAKNPADAERKLVPSYDFAVCRGGEKIGAVNLRIGYTDGLYYGGQIGYGIDEKYRGRGCAGRACRLLAPVAKAHGMKKLLITNNYTNAASRRVCEKLGAKLLRVARLPEWHDLYKEGQRFSNIFEWSVE